MRKLIMVRSPKQIMESHTATQRANMTDAERQRIEDAEIRRDIIESERIADARLRTESRRASEGR